MSEDRTFATRAAHAGRAAAPSPLSRPLTPPIYQTTVYAFDGLEDLDNLHEGVPGHIYYRSGSPNHTALEEAVATLEGAEAAISAASGMAVISAAILSLAGSGDHIVADRHSYGVTYALLTQECPRLGINVTLVDATDLAAVEKALIPGTKALLVEALSNPILRVVDIPALCALGRARDVPVLVDATFVSPALFRPIEHGASLSWHSLAKYLGGHSAAVGGVGSGDRALVAAIRQRIERFGGSLGVMDAWLTLLGLPTLPLRMKAHTTTANAVAAFVSNHPAVSAVHYPGLATHPRHTLAQQLYPEGSGGMLSFELRGGEPAARQFLKSLKLIAFAPSLADVTTTVSYPCGTSHYGLTDAVLREMGVSTGLIRFSAGIETPEDVIADLNQALAM